MAGHFVTDINTGALPAFLPFIKESLSLSYTMTASIILVFNLTSSVIQPIFGYSSDRWSARWLLPGRLFRRPAGIGAFRVWFFLWLGIILRVPKWDRTGQLSPRRVQDREPVEREEEGFGQFALPLWRKLGICSRADPGDIILQPFWPKRLSLVRSSGDRDDDGPSDHSGVEGERGLLQATGRVFGKIRLVAENTFPPDIAPPGRGFQGGYAAGHIDLHTLLFHQDTAGGSDDRRKYLSVFLLAATVGGLTGGPLADRYGYKRVVLASLGSSSVFLYLFFFTAGSWSLIFFALAGLILTSSYAVTMAMGQSFMPRNVGMASGLMMGLSNGIGGIVATLLGWVADQWGVPFTLQVIFLLPLLGFLTLLFVPYPPEFIQPLLPESPSQSPFRQMDSSADENNSSETIFPFPQGTPGPYALELRAV